MLKRIAIILCLFCKLSIFAESTTYASITTALAYEPFSAPISGGDHFAPPTKFWNSGLILSEGVFGATFPIPFGDNPLFSSNYVQTQVALMLSPVSISPTFSVVFSPLPFLIFKAGASIGGGWDFGSSDTGGLSTYDKTKKEYIAIPAFSSMYYDAFIEGTFLFDIAAIIPGDWNHIITVGTYALTYKGITSGGKHPWSWLNAGEEQANGLVYSASALLGYQLPLEFETMFGITAGFSGYFFEDDFNTESHAWDPTFMTVSLSAIIEVTLSDNHTITLLSGFETRRSYDKEYADTIPVFGRVATGSEWVFAVVGLFYTYNF